MICFCFAPKNFQFAKAKNIIKFLTLYPLMAAVLAQPVFADSDRQRPNVIFITVDDMNHDTPESFGGRVESVTPNIDALAAEGMRFVQAYNASSRCAPSRGAAMTGHYQDTYNERPGTSDTTVRASVATVPEYLREEGYLTGLFGKERHYKPLEKYGFDVVEPMAGMALGRSPDLYAEKIGQFVDRALAEGRPFFVSANSHDPHRPFAGSDKELKRLRKRFRSEVKHLESKPRFIVPPSVDAYSGTAVTAPSFVPDHPLMREEFGYYLNSSHRADAFVGAILEVLAEKGVLERSIVIFRSDNGMDFPFAKANAYINSVKTPLIVYWPGHTVPGAVSDSLVSTVDLVPTLLDVLDIEAPATLPGRSLIPLISDPTQPHHDRIFVTLNGKATVSFAMRSLIEGPTIYIYNAWADGRSEYYDGQYFAGRSMEAFEAAADEDEEARDRLAFFRYRAREELYDIVGDPDALHNLVDIRSAGPALDMMRRSLHQALRDADDPLLEEYERFLETELQTSMNQTAPN